MTIASLESASQRSTTPVPPSVEGTLATNGYASALASLLSNYSHATRNPLHTVLGNCELLIAGAWGGLTEQQRDRCAEVFDAARQFLIYGEELMDVARLEAGKLGLERSAIGARELLAIAEQHARRPLERKKVRLAVVEPEPDPVIFADNRRIAQVLVNLLGIAMKQTPAGGTIQFGARAAGMRAACYIYNEHLTRPEAETYIRSEFEFAVAERIANLHGGELRFCRDDGAPAGIVLSLPLFHGAGIDPGGAVTTGVNKQ